ncbi:unnamed protein product [Cyprideis torosa]|uniref:Uncharacterized protein n=1 Tax=Cyprideis torosa TaxID=163714 RepID=A0A7R8WUH2_9CRUS|nr:unnamed protein product [Cyprideis torosa]CAG0905616.1 unnamed protein product [Cyprideis torosa]
MDKTEDASKEIPSSVMGVLLSVMEEIIYSPLNLLLVGLCIYMTWKLFRSDRTTLPDPPPPPLPKLKKQDMTLEQLKVYDGEGPEGRILMAVNSKIFDVTKARKFYGPGGPYANFAGRDASRGLATFNVAPPPDGVYDDLSDISKSQMDSLKEWEEQFIEKYDYVGRLIRPGERARDYEDEETEPSEAGGETPEATPKGRSPRGTPPPSISEDKDD